MDTAATDELSPEALRQLVGSLKPGQIRHLKLLLDNRYVVDLMVELPLELICLVASHLDPVDYRACLCVSKEWRHRFLAEPLWRTVMDSNFHILPVQAKAHDTCVDFDTFRKHLRRVACRSSGVAQRQFKVSMTEDFVFPPENSSAPYHPSNPLGDAPSANLAWWDCPYMLYADGKVAWGHLGVGSVVLDCLRTGVRSIVPSPVTHIQAGNHNKLLALGDQLVVWAVAHRVIAYNHITKETQVKRLPISRVDHCCVDGTQIVLFGGDKAENALFWHFGGRMRAFTPKQAFENLTTDSEPTSCFINCGSCFLLHCATTTTTKSEGGTRTNSVLRIQEYREGGFVRDYDLQLDGASPSPHLLGSFRLGGFSRGIRAPRSDSYGRYFLAWYHDHGKDFWEKNKFFAVEFDAVKRRFRMTDFPLVAEVFQGAESEHSYRMVQFLLWNKRLVATWLRLREETSGNADTCAIVEARPDQGLRADGTLLISTERKSYRVVQLKKGSPGRFEQCLQHQLLGDDEFLIQPLAPYLGYEVWQFGVSPSEISLPPV